MSKSSKNKEKIFEIYSRNLAWVKSHPKIQFVPDFTEGYLCPLCFNLFRRDSLTNNAQNQLTIEHNPPRSLGGKPNILTCKDCNSKAGHEIDNHLLAILDDQDFFEFKPNTSKQVGIKDDDKIVNGVFSIDDDGSIGINILTRQSNPINTDHFFSNLRNLSSAGSIGATFNALNSELSGKLDLKMRFKFNNKTRLAEVSMLKIAYLKAFEILGNGFLINPHLKKVRDQILNPSQEIIPESFAIDLKTPEEVLGIGIITEPKEFRCFIVVFQLQTKTSKKTFSIVLPGLSAPGINIYENLQKLKGENVFFKIEVLNAADYLKSEDLAFASHNSWRILVGS